MMPDKILVTEKTIVVNTIRVCVYTCIIVSIIIINNSRRHTYAKRVRGTCTVSTPKEY